MKSWNRGRYGSYLIQDNSYLQLLLNGIWHLAFGPFSLFQSFFSHFLLSLSSFVSFLPHTAFSFSSSSIALSFAHFLSFHSASMCLARSVLLPLFPTLLLFWFSLTLPSPILPSYPHYKYECISNDFFIIAPVEMIMFPLVLSCNEIKTEANQCWKGFRHFHIKEP